MEEQPEKAEVVKDVLFREMESTVTAYEFGSGRSDLWTAHLFSPPVSACGGVTSHMDQRPSISHNLQS
jgi:hypothetical protein